MQENKVNLDEIKSKRQKSLVNEARSQWEVRLKSEKLPEDYKNELQFVFETQIAKLETALTQMRGAVDKSRSIPSEEVHQSLIRAYGELLKIGDMLGSVNCNLRWHNGDHSMYEGVDG